MQTNLTIGKIQYPVTIQGEGKIDCLCIGLGNLMQRSLSSEFKKTFTVTATDLYFVKEHQLADVKAITMQRLVTDILETIAQLKLEKPVIVAHSCFGIVALEVAKQAKANLRGVILVASAPQWNEDSLALTEDYFQKHAEPALIENDKKRKQHYAQIKKPTDSEVSLEKYISDTARYWGNFDVADSELRALWEGIDIDDAMINQFFETILPNHNLAIGMEKIKTPVILLAGHQDYDSIPLVQWATYPQPAHFTIIDCGDVGHWPQLESTEIFDNSIKQWIDKIANYE